ncbi:MAG: phospholipase [Deltaproteobacteria bacterium]|nr:phospholipase [Deltaproteobacteria bacterium]
MDALRRLARSSLELLAEALSAGRLPYPPSEGAIQSLLGREEAKRAAQALADAANQAFSSQQMALVLTMLARERSDAQAHGDSISPVWSGPEVSGSTLRSTSVVVQSLFRHAREEIVVAAYAFDRGEKARAIFGSLAARMDSEPQLRVRLIANVERRLGDQRSDAQLVRAFGEEFRKSIWPGSRLPEVFFDPRSLRLGDQRSCWHAKLILVDRATALVTSANFTESAAERNYEAGLLVTDGASIQALAQHIDGIISQGLLESI